MDNVFLIICIPTDKALVWQLVFPWREASGREGFCFSALVSAALINSMTKNNLERKGFPSFIRHRVWLIEVREGPQGRNLEAGAKTETMEELC